MYNPATFQMFRSLISFFGLVFFFLLLSCSDQKTAEHSKKENLCQHSQYLRIYNYQKGYKVEILDPDQQRKLHVFQIQKPYARIAVLSATHVGMLSALGQQEKICAISNAKYLLDPQVKRLLQLKRIVDLRTELGFSAEKLLQRKAQVVVYSGFGNESQQLKRLPAHMLKIANFEWREKTPLARAEWVLLFGALCGQFAEAQQLFEEIQANYIRIQKEVQQNNHSNQLPILLSGNLYGDQWIAPAGQSFEAHLYKDAGLAYLFSKEEGTGSVFKSLAEILRKGPAVCIWLNPGLPSRKAILKQYPKAQFFPFFKKPIYCYTSNTNKYWEQAAVHPDWLLSDLSRIASGQTKKLHFYALLK
jgi:iron complex transport system substrate-binding protein